MMIFSAAQQATASVLALASAHTGPGFTLPGSGKEKDPGLGALARGSESKATIISLA